MTDEPMNAHTKVGSLLFTNPKLYEAAQRVADLYNEVTTTTGPALLQGAKVWLAFRLSDGTCDEVAYFERAEAIKAQLHEYQCMYLQLSGEMMTVMEAAHLLATHRRLYDQGVRLIDPKNLGTPNLRSL